MSHIEENQVSTEELELERELAKFADSEAKKLGIGREQYTEKVNTEFWAEDRATTTIWVSGLTMAHDQLVAAALSGVGYKVVPMDAVNNESLQFGKEFGNKAQCNPTYFTVGHLVKTLVHMRDREGIPAAELIEKYIFLTAGACGPCRFGTYVTEYRKALRDAGFEGFRVLLFQQQGGIKQATGRELGLKIDKDFAVAVVRALIAGDVVNLQAYRMRPYEVVEGSTNVAVTECKDMLDAAFRSGKNVHLTMWKCRKRLAKVEIDRTNPKPVVSVIGEFWAMTTEGDGNYGLQKFLEQEGAEVDVQGVTNWILFMIWENKYDRIDRLELRAADGGKKGLEGTDATKTLRILTGADKLVRVIFQSYAKIIGLHGYHLPDMDEIAELAGEHYDNNVRGGEGHMEVGKLIHFAVDHVNHMTVSVKPFGCMPSSGVSDGVQSMVSAKYPESIFLPIETTGDGAVNVYSRIQMMLFKARNKAKAEFELALEETGLDEETYRKRVKGSRRWSNPFLRPPHKVAGVAANLVYAVS